MEFQLRLGKCAVECVQHYWSRCAVQKRPREGLEHGLGKQSLGPNKHILHAHGVIARQHLARPLVQRIDLVPEDIVALGLEHPLYDAVVDRHADELAEDLAEEDGPRRDVHVVAYFLVLQHVLRAVPDVAGDGTVGGGAGGVFVA